MQIHEAETNKCKKKLMFESNEFEQGIEFALANGCDGLQIRNTFGAAMDFRLFEKVANQIVFLSITGISPIHITNFEYIYSFQKLETLYSEEVDLPIDFKRFGALQNIGIVYNKNFQNLDKLKHLKSAVIRKFSEQDLRLFSNWESIKVLHIYQSKIESLQGIAELRYIDTLVLAHNRKLKDISSINQLNYVADLSFEKNSGLRDYSELANNQSVHGLFISELDNLEFIKSMESLTSFRFWNCKDGNLFPLLESPTLKKVCFTPNKKHYSHTMEQINRLITNTSIAQNGD